MFIELPGSPVSTGYRAGSVAFNSSGTLMAVTSYASPAGTLTASPPGSVTIYSVGPAGATTRVSSATTGAGPYQVKFSPDGSLIGLVNAADNTVQTFGVSSGGTLTAVGSPTTIGPGANPSSLAFSPDGKTLAVANQNYSDMYMYSVASNGTLTYLNQAIPTGNQPDWVSYSPDGSLLAVNNLTDNTVQMYTVGSAGALTKAGAAVPTGSAPIGLAFSPDGKTLAIANSGSNTIGMYSIGSGGSLTSLGTTDSGGTVPRSLAFSPSGNLLQVANEGTKSGGGSFAVFSVGSGGSLVPVAGSPYTASGIFPWGAAFSPAGWLFATSNFIGGSVSLFGEPPVATISSPVDGQTFDYGTNNPVSYGCQDGPDAPGIASCAVAGGASGSPGTLDTSSLGTKTYTVTATSKDGLSSTASIHYTVQQVQSSITLPGGLQGGDATYGDQPFTISTNSPLPLSVNVSGQCQTVGTNQVQVTGVGTCNIDASQPGNTFYTPATLNTSITVDPATIKINAHDASQMYGGPTPALGYTLSGFVNGQNALVVTGGANCTVNGTDVGTYPITCAPGSLSAPNYSFVTGSLGTLTITPASQAITFFSNPPSNPTYGGNYSVDASADSGLPVALSIDPSSTSGACSVSGSTVNFTGTGSCVIDADQPGNNDYQAAPQVQQTLSIGPAPQTITFGSAPPLNPTYGGSYAVSATSDSGLPVTLSIDPSSTSGACSLSGSTVNFTGPGTCVIDADQPGNSNYQSAQEVQQTLTVQPAPQAVSYAATPPSNATYGSSYSPAASADSGLSVTLSVDFSSTPGACSMLGQTVSFTGVGTCVIDAGQLGNADYLSAQQVQQTIQVGPAPISVGAQDASVPYGQSPNLAASLSGLVNGDTAQTAGLTGSASCSLGSPAPSNPGSYPGAITCAPGTLSAANYYFVQGSPGNLTITQVAQAISFPAPTVSYGAPDFSPATASSGLPIAYTVLSGPCTVDAQGLLQVTGAGTCTVKAAQSGNSGFAAASPVTVSFPVGKAPLMVNANDASAAFPTIPPLTSALSGFVGSDTASSVAITGSANCSVAAGIGTVAGNFPGAITCGPGSLSAANYYFVQGTSGALSIGLGSQSISFPAPTVSYGAPDFSPATASSGLPIVYTVQSGPCSTDAQGLLVVGGAGTCVVTANQPGNGAYGAATPVTVSFQIAKVSLSVNANNATVSGGQTPSLSATLSGFVHGDTALTAGVSGAASCAVAAGTPTGPGSYPGAITCAPGNLAAASYNFVQGSSATLTITSTAQTISFPAQSVTYGGADFGIATASSGLPVTYTVVSGPCTIDSQGLIHATGAGMCTVKATQAGDANWSPAPAVTQTFQIQRATLSVNANPATTNYGQAPTLSSTLTGFVNGDTTSSAKVSGTASCSVASGTSSDAGTYPGVIGCSPGTLSSANYTFAKGTSATLTIVPVAQTVNFTSTAPSNAPTGTTYTMAAAATSGLPVSYSVDSSSSAGACSITGTVVSFTGPGTCVIDGKQAGNKNWLSAQANQSIGVSYAALVFAYDTSCTTNQALQISGSTNMINGVVHSNGAMHVSGNSNVLGPTSYGGPWNCSVKVDGNRNQFSAGAPSLDRKFEPWPVDYRTNLPACTYRGSNFNFNRGTIPSGVYCATGSITVSGNGVTGNVTFVAPNIQISGNSNNLTAYANGLLAYAVGSSCGGGTGGDHHWSGGDDHWSGGDDHWSGGDGWGNNDWGDDWDGGWGCGCGQDNNNGGTLQVSGNSQYLVGSLFAPYGPIQLSGSRSTFKGLVEGLDVQISGSNHTFSAR